MKQSPFEAPGFQCSISRREPEDRGYTNVYIWLIVFTGLILLAVLAYKAVLLDIEQHDGPYEVLFSSTELYEQPSSNSEIGGTRSFKLVVSCYYTATKRLHETNYYGFKADEMWAACPDVSVDVDGIVWVPKHVVQYIEESSLD